MKLRVLQIRDPKNCMYVWASWDFAKSHWFSLEDYECVYETSEDADHNLHDYYDMLREYRPNDFKGHDATISDILELDGHPYYIDRTEFVDTETEKKYN